MINVETINGYKVMADYNLMDTKTIEVRRTFFDKLFSLSWFTKFKTVILYTPSEKIIINEKNHIMIMHPSMVSELRKRLNKEPEN